MLKDLEKELNKRGFSTDVRKAIRNAKICIIDDRIDHLKSFMDGLRKEGFTNLIEKTHVESINELLENAYELIILDLKGVAEDISSDDGIGVIESLKHASPALPILVISGTTTSPDKAKTLSMADLIRTKPVFPADLASDVDDILKTRKDPYWSALTVLKELQRIQPDIRQDLCMTDKIKLWLLQQSIINKLKKHDESVTSKVLKVVSIVEKLGTITIRIVTIANGIGS
ncbi:MAG TPA: response regulator [Phycisphaerales bacterium]|nr:response regulator [Phycisphaerales bacterium]